MPTFDRGGSSTAKNRGVLHDPPAVSQGVRERKTGQATKRRCFVFVLRVLTPRMFSPGLNQKPWVESQKAARRGFLPLGTPHCHRKHGAQTRDVPRGQAQHDPQHLSRVARRLRAQGSSGALAHRRPPIATGRLPTVRRPPARRRRTSRSWRPSAAWCCRPSRTSSRRGLRNPLAVIAHPAAAAGDSPPWPLHPRCLQQRCPALYRRA